MQDNFELSNAEGLDESISSAMGLENQSNFCCGADGMYYYNVEAGTGTAGAGTGAAAGAGAGTATGGTKIDPEKVKQGIQLAAGVLQGVQSRRSTGEADIDAACGKKPFCVEAFGNKCNQRKEKYQKCVQEQQTRKTEAPLKAQELENEKQRLQAQMEQTRLEQQRLAGSASGSDDKFLGMPKAVGITVAVVGGLALIVGGIFLVRKMRK